MAYVALYRKFRPDTFEDVKGQDPIVKTLRNQIQANRIGHAYLFCGTRGTGKTSVAKILARAVNCEHPVNGSPCNECASCRAIAAGSAMNVIEIDAASNNGVDNIREIREEVAYSPAEGRYKVYIIDEVHMLSTGAFNALLKTLEEPPSYVIFILATTEAHKIPTTILSRCQRYDFRRIGQQTIYERLKELVEAEHVDAEEKALRYIAKKGDGALRDALSLLDQCIAFYLGETLTYDRVLEVLGAVDTDVFSDLLRKILSENIVEVISTLETLILQGRDLAQFVSDFTWYLRNLMLLKASDDMEDVLDVSSENLVQLREEAGMIRSDTLMRFIRIFSELSGSIRYATNKRVQLEMALIRLCRPETESDEISLVERIRRLERVAQRLEDGGYAAGGNHGGVAGGSGGYGQAGNYGGAGGYGGNGQAGNYGGADGYGQAGNYGGMPGGNGQTGNYGGTSGSESGGWNYEDLPEGYDYNPEELYGPGGFGDGSGGVVGGVPGNGANGAGGTIPGNGAYGPGNGAYGPGGGIPGSGANGPGGTYGPGGGIPGNGANGAGGVYGPGGGIPGNGANGPGGVYGPGGGIPGNGANGPGGAYGFGGGIPGNGAYGPGSGAYGPGGVPGVGTPPVRYQKAVPEDLKKVRAMWKSIVSATSGMFRVVLSAAEPKFNSGDEKDGRLYVVFADFMAERYLTNTERKAELEQIIAEKTGKTVEVKFILAADEGIQKGVLSKIEIDERIHEFIHTDIEIEDEN